MMGLSDGRKSVRIGLAVLIQYRSVTDTQPPSHVAVAITLNAQASSLKNVLDVHKGGRRGHKNLFKSIGLTLRYLHSVTEMLINGIHILNAVLTGLLL